MGLSNYERPREVFFGLPFELRDKMRRYREAILVAEDRFEIKIVHGDYLTDAVSIHERAIELMRACRVLMFDLTEFNPNIVYEFGCAFGFGAKNIYAFRKQMMFGTSDTPSMLSNIDLPTYKNIDGLEKVLSRNLRRHYWPTDAAFTESDLPWLSTQIRDLTYPSCETDKIELADAIGINATFVTQAIQQYFVATGDATPITIGPVPRYRFDYNSIRPVPGEDGLRIVS